MSEDSLQAFIDYCTKHIKGDEKGEAQTFLERFFIALGYPDGHKETGGSFEWRVKGKDSTSFADFVWKKRVLIEMKKADEDLSLHLLQVTNYWMKLAGDRPRYIILCNFNEFWIYDFDKNIYDPVDVVKLKDIVKKKSSFGFLLPKPITPLFRIDHKEITEKAAKYVAHAFSSMCNRRVRREDALRYCMQCIVAMFSQYVGLLPDDIFTRIIEECEEQEGSAYDIVPLSYDLIGGLFREMNSKGVSEGERYRGVEYFNGGLFSEIIPVNLTKQEVVYFGVAAGEDWKAVNPAIFGTIFEQASDEEKTNIRHKLGMHYTHEIDIKKIVVPVIVQPWLKKIEAAETLDELYELLAQLRKFKVLDPACGSGNFLFIAYKEMKLLEKLLLARIRALSTKPADARRFRNFLPNNQYVSVKQFYGIDTNPFAVELARVTLMVAKELWVTQHEKDFDNENALPLDNLDKNIICADALFTEWPEADAIIGNPPYQSKNKMQEEFGAEYVNKLREAYPEVPGRADFCVYWFYKAHKHLKENSYAGLVGTNTIRQNYSREGSLDYIVKNGGTIIEAVSSEPWSGEAAVHVSIASWKKGKESGKKNLFTVDENENIHLHEVENINSSLSLQIDVTSAKVLECNKEPKKCFQGQTHGHEGFLLSIKEANKLLNKNKKYAEVLKPFLVGDELVGNFQSQPKRFVIDFTTMDMNESSSYKEVFKLIQETVLPEREVRAKEQEEVNKKVLKQNPKAKVNKHHINFFNKWWKLSWGREDMLSEISRLKRYVACARVTQRQIFEFVSTEINPSDQIMIFLLDDDYSFGIIQSKFHWQWLTEKCSTLGIGNRYTTDTVWDTFPFPQSPTQKQIEKIAAAAKTLRDVRNKAMKDYNYSLRDLYRVLEKPGKNAINDLQKELDNAVMEAYGFDEKKDLLSQLLELNLQVAEKEKRQEKVQAPGLPDWVKNKEKFVSDDCVRFEEN